MHDYSQALAESALALQLLIYPLAMQALNLIVVGRDDGLFAREGVVSGTCGNLSGVRDVAHGGDLEAVTAAKGPGSFQNLASGAVARGLGRRLCRSLPHEPLSNLSQQPAPVQRKVN